MIFSKKINSRLENISEVLLWFEEKIKNLTLSENDIFDLRVCLEEALVNAIKHGNKLNPNLVVEILLEIKDKSLVLEIKDEGSGFDVNNLPDPTMPENIEKLSGRGLFLIKHLVDKVEFLDNGSRIRLIKFL